MNQFKFLFCIFLYLISNLSLSAQAYEIRSYDVDIQIQLDGDIDVHEIITVDFNVERRGIMREIPKSIKVNDIVQKVKLSDVSVSGFEYKRLSEGNNNIIRIGNPKIYLTGIQTYDIKYTLSNVMLRGSDHTAFQYNIIADWDTSIDTVNYTVTLPRDLDIRYSDYRVFTGRDNANERDANILKEGNKLYGHSYNRIAAQENITIAVKFPLGYFKIPSTASTFVLSVINPGLHHSGFFILILAYFKRFRTRFQT